MVKRYWFGLLILTSFAGLSACGVDSAANSSTSSASTTSTASTTTSTSSASGSATLASLQFNSANTSVPAAGGTVSVSVMRSGSASSAVSVKYATADGTAVAGTNYTGASGTLTWASGETTAKSVTLNVASGAGGKTFSVVLSNATGANLANPATETIAVASATVAAATSAGTGNPNFAVKVSGDHFVDANNNVLQMRGVNASGLEYAAINDCSTADPWCGQYPNWTAVKSWDSNVVRVPLNEASWLGYQCVDGNGQTRDPDPGHNYQATVKKTVSDATAAGLYVILDLHWAAPSNFCPLAQNQMADADNSIGFWSSMAATFKGYPNVMFELFNEPYFYWLADGLDPWKVLMQGGAATAYVTGNGASYTANYNYQTAGMQQMLNAIRATGATNVVLIAGVSWAQDLSGWVANKPNDPLNQIGAVWHAYPNSDVLGDLQATLPKFGSVGYTWTSSVMTAGFPVFITEFGDHDTPGTVGAPFVSNLLPWADAHGASYTGWTWDVWGEADDVLIKDASGTPTDGYGVYTQAHYLCVGAGGSNCQ